MAKSKSKRATPAAPAPLPPLASGPTEDQLRAERIAEIKQLPYFEVTERIGDDGLPVAGSWSLPNWAALPISRHGQRPVCGVRSPWEESVILVPDQVGDFGRVRLLPAPPLSEEQKRNVLAKKIEQLSETIPLASIQMVQLADPLFEGRINASPQDLPAPHDAYRKWPIEGLRSLWEQSVQYIPDARLRLEDEDGGFVRWLWTQVQKLWGIRKVEGLAIDPYGMWMKALTRHPNSIPNRAAMPVASNPLHATAEEILRVAEHAKGLARGSIRTKSNLAEEEAKLCESVSALHRLRTTPPEGTTLQEWQHRIRQTESDVSRYTRDYRQTYLYWLGLKQWHKVVELYERALIKKIAAQRPPLVKLPAPSFGVSVDYEALSLHLDRVAVELEGVANMMATESATPAGRDSPIADVQADTVTRQKRATKSDVQRGTMAAIGHLLSNPSATGKACAMIAGISESTLSKQVDWINWKQKIMDANDRQRKTYKESFDTRTGEFQSFQPEDDC